MGRLKELLVQKLDAELASWKPFFKSQIKTRNFAVIDEAYTRDKLAGYPRPGVLRAKRQARSAQPGEHKTGNPVRHRKRSETGRL